jgi:small-conductance mechanosensitive channel
VAKPPIDNLLTRLIDEGHDTQLLWQLVLLGLAVALAWMAVRLIKPYLSDPRNASSAGREGLSRLVFPLIMLLAVLVGRALAEWWLPSTHLLNLVVPLLLALMLVRLVVYALRYAFHPSEALKAWERTAAWLIWGIVALHVTGLSPRIRGAMEALSFQSGSYRFSLWLLFQAALVIMAALIAALGIARLIETKVMGFTQINLSLRMALAKGIRTVILIVAVLVALPALGIDLTVLSVFGGALGVGIGFGLQKIASNYISGFIILLDRSVRIGDLVTVDNRYGEVSQINTRFTLLKALDGTESIVPNETLISQTVVNHSLTRPDVRITLSIQVSYDTDLELAESLMLEAARGQSRVIHDVPDNEARVYLKEFADNGVLLELAVWIRDASAGQNNLRSDINWAIWRRFKAAGIEIPFPQRVVHMALTDQQGAKNA